MKHERVELVSWHNFCYAPELEYRINGPAGFFCMYFLVHNELRNLHCGKIPLLYSSHRSNQKKNYRSWYLSLLSPFTNERYSKLSAELVRRQRRYFIMVLIDNSKLVIIRIYKEHFINFIYGVSLSIYIIRRCKNAH